MNPMNIIRMTGGLGNQMFQYALYLNFISKGIDCKFEDWTEYENKSNARPILLNKAFDINYPVASKEEYIEFTDSYMDLGHRVLRKLRGRQSREYSETTGDYDASLLGLDNSYITGFFQSEKYFGNIEDIVRKSFVFTDEVIAKSTKLGTSVNPFGIETEPPTPVSIHIRRGDYLKAEREYGNICTDEYYVSAIKYICDKVRNPHFLVFCNDTAWAKQWCSENISLAYRVIENTSEETGYLDMCLMSRCAHNIIANSTFSWWGAYLNTNPNKIVIAPAKWNNVTNQKDIYSSWMTTI